MKSPIVIVAAHHLRRLVRRPVLVLFLTAVPLTLAFVESAAFGPAATTSGAPPPVPVLFADEDQSGASKALEACVTDGIADVAVVRATDDEVLLNVAGAASRLQALLGTASRLGEIREVLVSRPTLETLFLKLTGRELRE